MKALVILCVVVQVALGNLICDMNVKVKGLPIKIQDELITILDGTALNPSSCSPPSDSDVKFWLYNKNNPQQAIIMNSTDSSQLDVHKCMVLIAPGWLSCPTGYKIPELKDAYVRSTDCNVVIVDWSVVESKRYSESVCQIPGVAQIVARWLCASGYPIANVHMVGHSLGAHLSGFTGKYTKKVCQQTMGRISGLDPAGPLYGDKPETERLSASDAALVSAIHTNVHQFGYRERIAQYDFFVNSCKLPIQPGCPEVNMTNLPETIVQIGTCSHMRAVDLHKESVSTNNFVAKSCKLCPQTCTTDSEGYDFAVMGEHMPSKNPSATYWLPTAPSSPFPLGCKPYPFDECPELVQM